MQAVSVISSSASSNSWNSPNSHNSNREFQEFEQLSANFTSKLEIGGSENDKKPENEENEDQEIDSESEDEDGDFTFVCTNPDGSPISADDIFQDGQIRPVFPLFNRDLLFADDGGDYSTAVRAASSTSSSSSSSSALRPPLKKLFFEENPPSSSASESDELEGVPEGTYCEWSKKPLEAAPELKNKSNSTGSSRLWRVRDLKFRSNSDGKDAFVFLSPNSAAAAAAAKESADKKSSDKILKTVEKVKGKAKKAETASSAHEKHYVKNREKKEGDKRRSYLPYRQDLVGFFTNVNGFSRNVHPF